MSHIIDKLLHEDASIENELDNIIFSPVELLAVQSIISFAKFHNINELFLGGEEGSISMLNIHIGTSDDDAGSGEEAGIDVLVTFLLSSDEIKNVITLRHKSALNLIGCFWKKSPDAPLLIETNDKKYAHVLCGIQSDNNSFLPFNFTQFTYIQRSASHEDKMIAFAKPHLQ